MGKEKQLEPPSADAKHDRQQNKATTRVLNVLSLFASEQASFGVTELSQLLGITKNMAYRALTTLVDQGFLIRDGTKYELGYGILNLVFHNFAEPDFRSIASPYIQKLHEQTGESILLSTRMQDKQVIIDGIEGQGQLVTRVKIGVSFPLHVSAASRAILASLSDGEIDRYLARNTPLEKHTRQTLASSESVWKDVEKTRKQGYARALEDYKSGSNSISFPILAANHQPHGAITVGGPKARLTDQIIEEKLPELNETINSFRKWAALYQSNINY